MQEGRPGAGPAAGGDRSRGPSPQSFPWRFRLSLSMPLCHGCTSPEKRVHWCPVEEGSWLSHAWVGGGEIARRRACSRKAVLPAQLPNCQTETPLVHDRADACFFGDCVGMSKYS